MPPNTSLDELFQEQLSKASLFKQQTSSRKQFRLAKLNKDQLGNQATIDNPTSMMLDFLQAFAPYGFKDDEVKEIKLKISGYFVKSHKVFTNDSLQTLADIGFFDNYEVFKNEIFKTLYSDLQIYLKIKDQDKKLNNLSDFIHKVFIIHNYENSFIPQFSEYLKNIKSRNKNDRTFRDFAE